MPGAVRGQVSGDFHPDCAQPAGHQICCVRTQFQRLRDRLSSASSQPGNIDRFVTQRDLVFATRCCQQLVDQPGELVGTAFGQVRQAAPQPWMFQGRGATEAPQATLIGCHAVGTGDSLCTVGQQPDRRAEFSGCRGAEESTCPAQHSDLHPLQRLCRWCTVRLEGREMQDPQRRFVCNRSA